MTNSNKWADLLTSKANIFLDLEEPMVKCDSSESGRPQSLSRELRVRQAPPDFELAKGLGPGYTRSQQQLRSLLNIAS